MELGRFYCSHKQSFAQEMRMVIATILALFWANAASAQVKDCSDYQVIQNGYRSPTCTSDELRAYLATVGIETAQPTTSPEPSSVPTPQPLPTIIPYFGKGVATGAELTRVTGHVRIDFETCPTNFNFGNHRRVQVHLGKRLEQSLFQAPAVADALLAKGARAAWKSCPQPFNEARTDFHYNVESVQILDGGGNVALSATLGTPGVGPNSDKLFASDPDGYAWTDVTDHFSADQSQFSQPRVTVNPDGSIPVGNREVQQRPRSDLLTPLLGFLWRWTKIIGGIWLVYWLITRREAIAEWYYSLTPHPASGQVAGTINKGLPIDGELFAAINQPFDGNKYEIKVRNQQADTLTERLRRHEASLRSDSEAILRKKREELLREQEFMRAHEALINAGVDHETAAAHLEALRKATEQ